MNSYEKILRLLCLPEIIKYKHLTTVFFYYNITSVNSKHEITNSKGYFVVCT